MSNPTPGPWRAGASTFYRGLDGPMTMRVYTDHPPTEFEVTGDNITANARLIAAASDLLDAAKEGRTDLMIAADNARDAAKTDPRWEGVGEKLMARVAMMDAAIARATGEKQ